MKRLIYMFTILSSLLIFNIIFSECSIDQYVKVNNLPEAIANANEQEVYTMYYNLGSDKVERADRYKKLYDFAKIHKYTIIASSSVQNGLLTQTNRYIYSNDNFNNMAFFKTNNDKVINFKKVTDEFISSDQNDDKAIDHLQFINKNYAKSYQDKIVIKQFLSFINDLDMKNTVNYKLPVYIISSDNSEVSTELALSGLDEYIEDDENGIEYENVVFHDIDQSFSLLVILIVILALIALSICQILKLKKEILIRKMLGQKSVFIFNKIFIRQIFSCILIYALTQILYYFLKVGNLGTINFVFIYELLKIYGLYMMLMFVTSLILVLIIKVSKSSTAMKKSGNMICISYGSLALKITFLILIISPFIGNMFLLGDVVKETYVLKRNEEKMTGYITIDGISGNDFENASQLVMNFYNENNGIYQDFAKNFDMEELSELLPSGRTKKLEHPYITVNLAYLNNYKLYTKDNELIKLNKLENNTLLVPETYKNEDMTPYCSTCSKLIIKNGNEFINHNAFTYDNYTMLAKRNPIVRVVLEAENWSSEFMFLKDSKINRKKLVAFLKEHKINKSIYLSNNQKNYHIALEENQDKLMNIIIIFGIYIVLTLVFQYQSIYIYFAEHNDIIAINYLLGKSFAQRYLEILSLNVLVYVLPFIYGIFCTELSIMQLTMFIIGAIMADFAIAYFMIRIFEKYNIIRILKGDN